MIKKLQFACLCGLASFSTKAQETVELSSFKSYNAGQPFTCITTDTTGTVWAGTAGSGLFLLSQNKTEVIPSGSFSVSSVKLIVTTDVVQSLAADRLGNVWVGWAKSGMMELKNQSLVKRYIPDRNARGLSFFERDGLATNNVKNVTTDIYNTVWSAHKYHDLVSSADYILTPGAMSYKTSKAALFITKGGWDTRGKYPEWPYPAYSYNAKPSESPQARTCYSIASDSNEVWISVASYISDDLTPIFPTYEQIPARILKYSLDGTYLGYVTFETMGIAPGGIFNGLYLSPKKEAWVTTGDKGFAVCRNGNWTHLNPSDLACIFPAGSYINDNAIWGNKYGNVFIGTTKGLIVYNGRGRVNSSSSYTFYSSATNPDMVSNNITGGHSEKDSIQWMATGSGVLRAVIGRYSTSDPERTDYKSCKNPEMDEIENLLKQPFIKQDKSYHIYKVETKICSISESKFCTGENIYKMIKDDVTLAAVTPYDFPLDDLSLPFLTAVTSADLVQIQKSVNDWPVPATPSSQRSVSGEIRTIAAVVENPTLKKLLQSQGVPFDVGQYLSMAYFGSSIPREVYMDRQLATNPATLQSCYTRYKLYNSPNFIQSRTVFKYGNSTFHGRILMGCDIDGQVDPEYDPIYSYANDKEYTATNYTAKGHMLYPGKITRQVVEECGTVKIVTIGEGVQFCGDNTAGRANANGNAVVGCILFKNVDFRFVRKFNTLK